MTLRLQRIVAGFAIAGTAWFGAWSAPAAIASSDVEGFGADWSDVFVGPGLGLAMHLLWGSD